MVFDHEAPLSLLNLPYTCSCAHGTVRDRTSMGQLIYIAVSEDGSGGFPPTSRNTLAEGVSYCEAYI